MGQIFEVLITLVIVLLLDGAALMAVMIGIPLAFDRVMRRYWP